MNYLKQEKVDLVTVYFTKEEKVIKVDDIYDDGLQYFYLHTIEKKTIGFQGVTYIIYKCLLHH